VKSPLGFATMMNERVPMLVSFERLHHGDGDDGGHDAQEEDGGCDVQCGHHMSPPLSA
jgi:hypothetical protein